MALTRQEKKEQRRAESLERKAKRDAAQTEVIGAKIRAALGFGVTYVATQILPAFIPAMAERQALIDFGVMAGGGYVALTNSDNLGDYALGAGLVGALQTFDTIGQKILGWFGKAPAA